MIFAAVGSAALSFGALNFAGAASYDSRDQSMNQAEQHKDSGRAMKYDSNRNMGKNDMAQHPGRASSTAQNREGNLNTKSKSEAQRDISGGSVTNSAPHRTQSNANARLGRDVDRNIETGVRGNDDYSLKKRTRDQGEAFSETTGKRSDLDRQDSGREEFRDEGFRESPSRDMQNLRPEQRDEVSGWSDHQRREFFSLRPEGREVFWSFRPEWRTVFWDLPPGERDFVISLGPEERGVFFGLAPEERDVFVSMRPDVREFFLTLSPDEREEFLTLAPWQWDYVLDLNPDDQYAFFELAPQERDVFFSLEPEYRTGFLSFGPEERHSFLSMRPEERTQAFSQRFGQRGMSDTGTARVNREPLRNREQGLSRRGPEKGFSDTGEHRSGEMHQRGTPDSLNNRSRTGDEPAMKREMPGSHELDRAAPKNRTNREISPGSESSGAHNSVKGAGERVQ